MVFQSRLKHFKMSDCMDCMDCILFIKVNKRDWLFISISFIYLFNYSTDPFEPLRVITISKSFETYQNVGCMDCMDSIWFLKLD